jgi:hypothetical protein
MLTHRQRRTRQQATDPKDLLIQHVENGSEFKRSSNSTLGLEQVGALGEGSVVEATWIRDILIGRNKPNPPKMFDPRGVSIHGALIRGELNLDGVDATLGLQLTACLLDTPLTLRDASLPWLRLEMCVLPALQLDSAHLTSELRVSGTRIHNPSGSALTAVGLKVGDGDVSDGAFMDGLDAEGTGSLGAVRMSGAKISGDLSLHGARLVNHTGPALVADGINVQGDMMMTGDAAPGKRFRATGAGDRGTVLLRGATISGQLSLRRATVTSRSAAVSAAPKEVGDGAGIGDPTEGGGAAGAPPAGKRRSLGAVCLSGATISGNLVLSQATLIGGTGPALLADILTLKGHAADCRRPAEGFRAKGSGERGAVCLAGATISGHLSLCGTTLTNRAGPALVADLVTIQQGARLDQGFTATGTGRSGAIRLNDAKITGDLSLRGARLVNRTGAALVADGINVQGDMMMNGDAAPGKRFRATGAGDRGTVLLRGATITGQLSLERAKVKSGSARARVTASQAGDSVASGDDPPARRRRSLGAVCLSGSTISGNLVLRHARLTGGTLPALMAENLTVKGHAASCETRDEGFTAKGSGELGAVCLAGATITGQLSLRGTTLTNHTGPALRADLITIQEDARLDQGFTATGTGPSGAVRLTDAKITGDLSLDGACLANHTGPALVADGINVRNLMMTEDARAGEPFRATGAGECDTILLKNATIGGQLSLERATVRRDTAPACATHTEVADGVARGGPDQGARTVCAGDSPPAAVCLSGSTINTDLVLRQATLCNHSGPALLAGYLTVKGDAALCEQPGDGFTATGSGDLGAVCLEGANITGQLSLSGTKLRNGDGPALMADFATIQGGAFLDQGFTATGAGGHGAVSLAQAKIGTTLSLQNGATLTNDSGPALAADGLAVQGDMFLDEQFSATGADRAGAVHIEGASIGKRLYCSGKFVNRPDPAHGDTQGPALSLARTAVGTLRLGSHLDEAGNPQGFETQGKLEFDGLTYVGLPELGDLQSLVPPATVNRELPGWFERRRNQDSIERRRNRDSEKKKVRRWLWWFRYCTAKYEGQPYQALAAAYGGAGYDDHARRILIAQRDDVRDRGSLSWVRKKGQYLAKWLIGYGYHCFYAFIWLAALFAVTALIAVFWFGHYKYIVTAPPATSSSSSGSAQAAPPMACTFPGRIGYAIELAFPIINLNSSSEEQCDVPAKDAEWGVVAFGWIVRAIAATLFVLYGLGLSGVTRSPPGGTAGS